MCDNKVKLVVGQAMQTRLKLPGKGRLGTGGSGWKASMEMLFGLCISYYISICLYSVQPAPELPYSHTIIRDEIGKMKELESNINAS